MLSRWHRCVNEINKMFHLKLVKNVKETTLSSPAVELNRIMDRSVWLRCELMQCLGFDASKSLFARFHLLFLSDD
ncbi:hypothetical protein T12_4053 [Trichinella patagoniensis]|uniref:Uncharacterized protein n=1 Tax=Trichinella patagoniensis TaxID=990121 RepID=A0A0V1A9A9_9BILA|nr:hypothetical protein T12_4053 [Trichinella patagoniensis]